MREHGRIKQCKPAAHLYINVIDGAGSYHGEGPFKKSRLKGDRARQYGVTKYEMGRGRQRAMSRL